MSEWEAVAAEVAVAIASVGEATTIRRKAMRSGPDDPVTEPELFEVQAKRSYVKVRDANGVFTGKTMTMLMISAGGVVPRKSDEVSFGTAKADVDADTRFHSISEVTEKGPTTVPLYFEVMLAD